MSRQVALLVMSMLLLCGAAYSQVDVGSETLANLAQALSEIRNESGSEPVSAETIDVKLLLGQSREAVTAAIGAPDNCDRQLTQQCQQQRSWGYSFFYLPYGWRGGGPELWLRFNADGAVQEAQWKFSR
jgi:hypothetical protein